MVAQIKTDHMRGIGKPSAHTGPILGRSEKAMKYHDGSAVAAEIPLKKIHASMVARTGKSAHKLRANAGRGVD